VDRPPPAAHAEPSTVEDARPRRPDAITPQVLVLGAGLAGLAAAYELKKAATR
jgi:NADPH-dependent 2,4-dienoyl-CoA reductase/sulfur reductase-like enzyme